ncbi:MAG: EAL domain-containing protein [Methylophilaceae bacterium]|nr:EAL domain-containing protein [Methylophilaceae bacterium]
MSKNEFELYYQPVVYLSDKTLIGAEELIRWKSAELGFLNPDQFVSIADERGIIVEIGRWVIETAFKLVAKWNKLLPQSIVIAVNISSKHLMQYDFICIVRHLLMTTGCEANWIKFEITESLLLQESTKVLDTLYFLNTLGIKISIEDFGTDYSALVFEQIFSQRNKN